MLRKAHGGLYKTPTKEERRKKEEGKKGASVNYKINPTPSAQDQSECIIIIIIFSFKVGFLIQTAETEGFQSQLYEYEANATAKWWRCRAIKAECFESYGVRPSCSNSTVLITS